MKCPKCLDDLEQYGIGERPNRECTACGWKERPLTENMRAALRQVYNSANGVEAKRIHPNTLAALERNGLVRVEFVNVVTPKGRKLGAQRMVFPAL